MNSHQSRSVGATPAAEKPGKRASLWRWLLLSPLFLLVLVGVLAFVLLATEPGSGWLLRQLGQLAAKEQVTFRHTTSRGTLLRRIELDDVDLDLAGTRVRLAHLVLAWQPGALLQRRLHIGLIELDDLQIELPASSDSGEPALLQIPDLRLPLAIRIDRMILDGLSVGQVSTAPADGRGKPLRIDHAGLTLTAESEGLRLTDLQLRLHGAQLSGELDLAARAPHTLDGRLAADIPADLTGDNVGDLSLTAALSGQLLRPVVDLRVSTPTELRAQASARLDRLTPEFDVQVDWPALRWPLSGDAQVVSRSGRLQLAGSADDYRVTLSTVVDPAGQPPLHVDLTGQGESTGLTLRPLRARIGKGELRVDGRVDWEAAVAWQLAIDAQGINPALFAPGWAGLLDGRVRVDGHIADDGQPVLNTVVEQLAGTLRGYPVSAGGALGWQAGALTADGLSVSSGPNRIYLDGIAGDLLDLNFSIEAPELAALYPGLAGRLSGKGVLSGTPEKSLIEARIDGRDLVFDDTRADALAIHVDWQGNAGAGEVRVDGLRSGGSQLQRIVGAIDGRLDAHRLQVDASGDGVGIVLAAQGGLEVAGKQWQGMLQRLSTRLPVAGAWTLREPAAVNIGQTETGVDALCVVRDTSEFCLRGGWSHAAGLAANGTLRALDLGMLTKLLPEGVSVSGQVDAKFDVKGAPGRPNATFSVHPGDGLVRFEGSTEPFDVAYRGARIHGRFENDQATAELRFEVGSNGHAKGKVAIGPDGDGQRPLDGHIDADFPDLSMIAGFVPALRNVQGGLSMALGLGGTLRQPDLRGDIVVGDASAQLPEAGITLADISLKIQGDDGGPLRIRGGATSGEGRLSIEGTADVARTAVDLRIRGDRFEAVRLPEVHALISPDLRLDGAGPYRLSGTLRIPQAAIEIKELPQGTVPVSEDQVIVAADRPSATPTGNGSLQAKVRVELGDDVKFSGFGLKTGLSGTLDARSRPQGALVDGKIALREATVKAYGQDLTVEHGRLLFAGPPDNPDVDLRAVRVSRDGSVRAYLAMSGPLAKPRPRVYSEPVLPEAEVVAYLLTGRGLDDAGTGEGVDIASAALSLGLSRSEPLLKDLGDRLGLDELRIESGSGGLADSSLLLGKYLNPDLYLGYSQGLFNPEGAVLLRLRLSEHLELESRSGNEQSADLFYKIEQD